MVLECNATEFSWGCSGVGLASLEFLHYLHIAALFQKGQMCGEIAVRETEGLFEELEIGFSQGEKRGHNTKARLLMNNFIQRFDCAGMGDSW